MTFLLWLVLVFSQCEATIFYVAPINVTTSNCPQHCHTLHYYATNSSALSQAENTQLVFLEGEHFLQSKLSLNIANVMNLSMVGYSTAIPSLYIADGSFIQVTNITYVTVQNLKIIGSYEILNNYFYLQQQVKIRGFILAYFFHVQILTSSIEMYGKILEVHRTSLNGSKLTRKHKNKHITVLSSTYMAYSHIALAKGNTASLMLLHCNVTAHSYIPSIDTTFMQDTKHVRIHMRDTHYRGKIALFVNSNTIKSVIFHAINCTFESSPIRLQNLFIQPNIIELVDVPSNSPRTINITINDTKFYGNKWRCVYINVPFASGDKITVSISHSNLTGFNQIMETAKEHYRNFNSNTFLTIQLNKVIVQNSVNRKKIPAITLSNVDQVLIKNSKFIDNKVTAIKADNSIITFSGTVIFNNNTGFKGGALSLYNSRLYFYDHSNVHFEGNTATEVGGAMYTNIQACLYIYDLKVRNVNVWFKNNWAAMGGHDIFGGYLNNSCRYWEHGTKQCYMYRPRNNEIGYKFHTSNTFASPTAVTCSPTRVCLCDEQGAPQCANKTFIQRTLAPLYPGETLKVSAVLVGCGFGTVTGIVYSSIANEQREILTKLTHEIQSLYSCTPLQYTLQSPTVGRTIRIKLSANSSPSPTRTECTSSRNRNTIRSYHTYGVIRDTLLHQNINLDLKMDDCPLGFVLRKTPPRVCSCHPRLEGRGVRVCTIHNHTGYVYRHGTTWISLTENKTDFVINQYCPYNYCQPENISIDLLSPNNQCRNNRSGILCGSCQGNLSLALGSPRCLHCENKHGFLTVGFFVAGILLVIFLKILDMTVSKGIINGMILYANVVWGSKSVLLATKVPHPTLQFLYTFIAWLNLDLGIETCFITGLDAIGKTWLQYVFPVYVWCIAGAIALVSRYSTNASRVFGYNSVPVLATLILLSYAKLLRNIIQSLSLSVIEYPQHLKPVWTLDGNIEYFSTQHSILFLAAVIVLLLAWLPFTLVLLTHQYLQRKSHTKYLNWINRWKPFFDAYLGQFKAKQQYWVGLLLTMRVILLLLLAGTSTSMPRINLLATSFVGVGLLIHCAVRGMPYRSKWLSLLEMTFILNFILLANLKLYTESDTTADMVITYISIGVVFVQFLLIVAYHTIVRFQTLYYRRRKRVINTHTELTAIPTNFYREPLLDS